jgi:hypothetical protein
MSSISITTGSEGPSHDPYSYERVRVERDGLDIVMHVGLDHWLKINGRKVRVILKPGPYPEPINQYYRDLDEIFERHAGISYDAARKAYYEFANRRVSRCVNGKKTHGRIISQRGFPGESFSTCERCGNVVDYYFNESEVM